jgi:uncharacterized membrane protein
LTICFTGPYDEEVMEEFTVALTEQYLKPTLELIGTAIIVIGVLLAVFRYVLFLLGSKAYPNLERIQLDLIHYLLFGLTIQVGADVLGTAVAPTVADLGALAGIVLVRAALSYFLSKDLERGVDETQEKLQCEDKMRA